MLVNLLKIILFSFLILLTLIGSTFLLAEYIYDSEWRWELRDIERLKELSYLDSSTRFIDSGRMHAFLEENPSEEDVEDFITRIFDSYYPTKRHEKSSSTSIEWSRGSSLWLIISEALLFRNNRKIHIRFLGTRIFLILLRTLGSMMAVIAIGSMAYSVYWIFETILGICLGMGWNAKPKQILSTKYQKKILTRDVLLILISTLNLVGTHWGATITLKKFKSEDFNTSILDIMLRTGSVYVASVSENGSEKMDYSQAVYFTALNLLLQSATTLVFYSIYSLYRSWRNSDCVVLTNGEFKDVLRKRGLIAAADLKDKMD